MAGFVYAFFEGLGALGLGDGDCVGYSYGAVEDYFGYL